MAAGATAAAVMFLAYVWYARSVFSLPARAHAALGMLFFGLVGLFLWPIVALAMWSRGVSPQAAFAYSLAVVALVTVIMLLAYARYARPVLLVRG